MRHDDWGGRNEFVRILTLMACVRTRMSDTLHAEPIPKRSQCELGDNSLQECHAWIVRGYHKRYGEAG